MGIDWEIIIKEFRKSLKKVKYDTLFEYANSFIKFVNNFPFITEDRKKDLLLSNCLYIITNIRNDFAFQIEKNFPNGISEDQATQLLNDVIIDIMNQLNEIKCKNNYILDDDFVNQYKDEIIKTINFIFEKFTLTSEQSDKIIEIVKSAINKSSNIRDFSGIIIAGYGDKEIFPSIYCCEICGKIGNSFIIFNEARDSISYKKTASIIPFAQKEMVETFMTGIDPGYQQTIEKELEEVMLSISKIVGNSYKDVLIKIKDKFIINLLNLQRKVYIDPIMDIVHSLQKTDLAEMAETLVNLTAFKRHISKDAETVGGPTDVAIITKGDGFVWIKRKHYFDIKLNPNFQQNYFMEDKDE
jgi:hypothetical protein